MNNSVQKGFTLIELIVVLVILGILAATAAPKFIDLQSDAVVAKLESMQGALKSANSMVHAKAIINGESKKDAGSIDVNGETITTTDGFITATGDNIIKAMSSPIISVAANIVVENADWGVVDIPGSTTGVSNVNIIPEGYSGLDNCMISYNTTAGDVDPAFYSITKSGC